MRRIRRSEYGPELAELEGRISASEAVLLGSSMPVIGLAGSQHPPVMLGSYTIADGLVETVELLYGSSVTHDDPGIRVVTRRVREGGGIQRDEIINNAAFLGVAAATLDSPWPEAVSVTIAGEGAVDGSAIIARGYAVVSAAPTIGAQPVEVCVAARSVAVGSLHLEPFRTMSEAIERRRQWSADARGV